MYIRYMDVWMSKARRTSKCIYCEQQIVNGDYVVVCKLWKRVKDKELKVMMFAHTFHYHVECWVAYGKSKVDEVQYVEKRGRKLTPMTDEDRANRIRIQRNRAAVVQRIGLLKGRAITPEVASRITRLTDRLEQYKVEIAQYGEVPKGW